MDVTELVDLLKNLVHLPEIRRLLEEQSAGKPFVPYVENVVTVQEAPVEVAVVEEDEDYLAIFSQLKELLASPAWPPAVDAECICDESLDNKLLRAEGLVDHMIVDDIKGKKILDFGCGEGHFVLRSLDKEPALAVGFDIADQNWKSLKLPEPHVVTTNWNTVIRNGPYDAILAYDVLDHIINENVVDVLNRLKAVLNPGGYIKVRCHPWCGRHATHLYAKINKAFIHLIFSDVELTRLGYGNGMKSQKIIHPHATYKQWFNDAGLELIKQDITEDTVEDFFHQTPILNQRIRDNYKGVSLDPELKAGRSFPSQQLRISFIDYLLKVS